MAENNDETKPKRRWLRFSLRTVLIVLTIFCVWLGWFLYRVEQQREAVKWVVYNGGTVHYGHELHVGKQTSDGQPFVPKLLLEILGDDYLSTVTRASFSGWEVHDVGPLARLTKLKSLHFIYSQVNDLTPLAGLTNLEELILDTQVGDVTALAGLTNLRVLHLQGTQVTDVTPLAGLTKLRVLHLQGTQVSDVTPLAGLTNLRVLSLDRTQVSDVSPLVGLTNLVNLELVGTQVCDLTPLAGLMKLEHLQLSETQVSYEQIKKLKQALPNCSISH